MPALSGAVALVAVVTSDEALGVVTRESATVGMVCDNCGGIIDNCRVTMVLGGTSVKVAAEFD